MSSHLTYVCYLFRLCKLLILCAFLSLTVQGVELWEAMKSGQILKMSPAEVKKEFMPKGVGVNAFADKKIGGIFHVIVPTMALDKDITVSHVLWTWRGEMSEDEWKKLWYHDEPLPDTAKPELQFVWASLLEFTEYADDRDQHKEKRGIEDSIYKKLKSAKYEGIPSTISIGNFLGCYYFYGKSRGVDYLILENMEKNLYQHLYHLYSAKDHYRPVKFVFKKEPCPLAEALVSGRVWKMSEQEVRQELLYGGRVENSQVTGENEHVLRMRDLRLFSSDSSCTFSQVNWQWEGTGEQERLRGLNSRLLHVGPAHGWNESKFHSETALIQKNLESILRLKKGKWKDGVCRYSGNTFDAELRTELTYPEDAVGNNKPIREGKLDFIITPKGGAGKPQRSAAPKAGAEQSPFVKALASGELWNTNAAAVREGLLRGSSTHAYADEKQLLRLLFTGSLMLQSGKAADNAHETEAWLHNVRWYWRGAGGNAQEWQDFWQKGAQNASADLRPLWVEGQLYYTASNKAAGFAKIETNRLTLLRSIFGSDGVRTDKNAGKKQIRTWRWESPQYVAELRSVRQFPGNDKAQLVDSSITLVLAANAMGILSYDEQKDALDRIFRRSSDLTAALQSGELWKTSAGEAREGLLRGMVKEASTDKQQRMLRTGEYTLSSSEGGALKLSDMQWGWQSAGGSAQEWQDFWKNGAENACREMRPLWLRGTLHMTAENGQWKEGEFNARVATMLRTLKQALGSNAKRSTKKQDNGAYTIWRWEKEQYVAELHVRCVYADGTKAKDKDKSLKSVNVQLHIAADAAKLTIVNDGQSS